MNRVHLAPLASQPMPQLVENPRLFSGTIISDGAAPRDRDRCY